MPEVFDVFLSYAHADNATGWVSALQRQIVDDSREHGPELRVFMDTSDIHTMQDWDLRIKDALRQSRLLLICLSPAYLASRFCRREWDDFVVRTATTAGDTKAVAYFVSLPDADPAQVDAWRERLEAIHHTDLRPWFVEGPEALVREDVRERISALGDSLYERIQRQQRAQTVPGNLRGTTPYFVGRERELRRLRVTVGTRSAPLTVVHGLGGMGKTELVIQYAHLDRDRFEGGVWQVEAEGERSLLATVAKLATVPQLGVELGDHRGDPQAEGLRVVQALRERCPGPDVRTLVLLDNVTEPDLVSAAELATLPDEPWLTLVATTRHGEREIGSRGLTDYVLVDKLDAAAALELLRDHQPARGEDRRHPDFAPGDEPAARELVALLDGFTLVLEQVAVYLGHTDERIGDYLEHLRADGLAAIEQDVDDPDVARQVRHRTLHHGGLGESLLSAVLDATVATLPPEARTAVAYAALLPPDDVPWPWLRALTREEHPELELGGTRRDPWARVQRRLESLRLVVSGDNPTVARMHRLVAATLGAELGGRLPRLQGLLQEVARRVSGRAGVAPWELSALATAALHVPPSPSLDEELGYAFGALAEYLPTSVQRPLATHLADRWRARDERTPHDPDILRNHSVSLDNVGRVAMAAGDLAAARTAYTESLTTRRRLAQADPGNAQAARDVSVSLDNVGRVAMAAGDLAAARTAYTESLTTRRRLAQADPGNAQAARDVSVSLWRLAELADQSHGPESAEALQLWREVALDFAAQRGMGWVLPSDEKAEAYARSRAFPPGSAGHDGGGPTG